MPSGLAVLASSILISTPAKTAPFEGVIGMRLALESGTGDMVLSLAGRSARLDMKVTVAPMPEPVLLTILHRAADPRSVLLLDERRKVWSEASLAEAGKLAERAGQGGYEVKNLGTGDVLGRKCVHVTLSRDKEFVDAWIAPDLKDAFAVLRTLQEANPQVGEAGLFRALEAAGYAGLPMRLTVIREGQRVTTEVSSLERKDLPASLFEVPRGWRRMDSAAPDAPASRPAAKTGGKPPAKPSGPR